MAAAVKKVNLSEQIFDNNVLQKPPIPGRPSSGRFHNRGNLFPGTCRNKLFNIDTCAPNEATGHELRATASKELVLHSTAITQEKEPLETLQKSGSKLPRRPQSAKERTRRPWKETNGLHKPCPPSKPVTGRPYSANDASSRNKIRTKQSDTVSEQDKQVAVIDLADEIFPDFFDSERDRLLALPDPRDYTYSYINDLPPMSFGKPLSTKYDAFDQEESGCKTNGLPKEVEENLKPSVYGLKKQRQVFGTVPDLTSANVNFEQFPYKLTQDDDTQQSYGQTQASSAQRKLPQTLESLRPWLTEDVHQEIIGIDPRTCLVFLPNVGDLDLDDLPEVPEPHKVEDDLPYKEDLTSPRPWNPKKYPHPFNKQPVEEWICKHRGHGHEPYDEQEWFNTYCKMKGRRRSQQPRRRTAEVIRNEIADLENLLLGIGNENSNCAMVRYQADVSRLQEMLDETMKKIPDRLKNPPRPADTFGLRRAMSEHDVIIARIRARVEECRQELAELEVEAGIKSDRQHFRKRPSSAV